MTRTNGGSISRMKLRYTVRAVSVMVILASGLFMGFRWWTNKEFELRRAALVDAAEVTAAHERFYEFFELFPQAIDDGLLQLNDADVGVLAQRLQLIARMLDDDYLLEVNAHNRRLSRKTTQPGAFSLHSWIALDSNAPWRTRLLELLDSPYSDIRESVADCLAHIAVKVPDILAAAPRPHFDYTAIRDLLAGLDASHEQHRLVEPFVRAALRQPDQLGLWRVAAGAPPRARKLRVVFEYLRRGGARFLDRSLGALLIPTGAGLEGAIKETWLEPVVRSQHPNAETVAIDALREGKLTRDGTIKIVKSLAIFGDGDTATKLEELPDDRRPMWLALDETIALLRRRHESRLLRTGSEAELLAELDYLIHAHCVLPGVATRLLDLVKSPPEKGVPAGDSPTRRVRLAAINALAAYQTAHLPDLTLRALLPLLEDVDYEIVHAAARTLVTITARWPSIQPFYANQVFDPLPIEVASSADLFDSWKSDWATLQPIAFAARYVNALSEVANEATEAASAREARNHRRLLAARGVAELARRSVVDDAWFAAHRDRLFSSYSQCDARTRGFLLRVAARLEAGWQTSWLWTIFDEAFKRDRVEAFAVIEAIGEIIDRRGGGRGVENGEEGAARLDEFVSQLIVRDGAEAAPVHNWIAAQFGAERVDEVILALALAMGSSSSRANLIRFFPIATAPPREHVQHLVHFLNDSDVSTRFRALEHLRVLSGGRTYGYDPKVTPDDPQSLAAIAEWQTWLGVPAE